MALFILRQAQDEWFNMLKIQSWRACAFLEWAAENRLI